MTTVLKRSMIWNLYVSWILANAFGEMIGLGLTFAVGIGSASLIGEPQGIGMALGLGILMAASGAIEGLIVGSAQWWVIQKAITEISRKEWVAATIIGALVAWTFAAIPTTMMSMNSEQSQASSAEPEMFMVLLMAGLMGAVLGIVLALAQWLVLRRRLPDAGWWLPANSAAWLVGMPVVFAAVDLAQDAVTTAQALLIFMGALALTGAIVGAIHGIVLVKFTSQEVK